MPDDRDRRRRRAVRRVRAATDRARRGLLARHRRLAAERRKSSGDGEETDERTERAEAGSDGTRHSTVPSTDDGVVTGRHSTVPRRPRGSAVAARERLYGERTAGRAGTVGSSRDDAE